MPNSNDSLERLKQLSQLIDQGDKVLATIETEGWREVISPMLDKMIVDVIGGKENGKWHNGSLDDKRLGEVKAQLLLSYKRALTDFHLYVHQFIDPLDGYKEEYTEMVRESEEPIVEKEVETDYDAEEETKED